MKTEPWEPESDLDRELVAVAEAFFARQAANDAPPAGRTNWRFTRHCLDRWHERFNPTSLDTPHPLHDVRSPKLKPATNKERQHIMAQCPGHSGARGRESLYFVLPDPEGGGYDRVFVVDEIDAGDRRFDRSCSLNYLVVTCFPLRAFRATSQVKNCGHQKRLRLKRSG